MYLYESSLTATCGRIDYKTSVTYSSDQVSLILAGDHRDFLTDFYCRVCSIFLMRIELGFQISGS